MISELLIYKICVQRYVKSETRQNKSALFCVSGRDDGLLSVANGAAVATKKQKPQWVLLLSVLLLAKIYLPWCSLETVSDLRPFLRRALRTRRPLAVCIRRRNPCLLILFLLRGWNVLFILVYFVYLYLLLVSLGSLVLLRLFRSPHVSFCCCLKLSFVFVSARIVTIGNIALPVCFDYSAHVSPVQGTANLFKTSAKLVNFKKSAKENSKNHRVFLSF